MVQTFTAERTDETFHLRRLPRRARRNADFLQFQSLGEVLKV
jgi:hypothetical protein